jgi:hypothetical protein
MRMRAQRIPYHVIIDVAMQAMRRLFPAAIHKCCMWMMCCPFVLLASQSGVAGAYIDVDNARAEVLFVLLRSKTTTLSAAM